MSTPARLRPPAILLILFLTITSVHADETAVSKCGSCPTVYYPPPPPPSIPPPLPPRPPTGYCPPPPYTPRSPPSPYTPRSPPSPEIIYITGPPGSLYPILTNGDSGRRSYVAAFGAGMVGFMMMW